MSWKVQKYRSDQINHPLAQPHLNAFLNENRTCALSIHEYRMYELTEQYNSQGFTKGLFNEDSSHKI